jgi:TolA-binding protein
MDHSQPKSLVEELVQEMNQPAYNQPPQYNNNYATPNGGYPQDGNDGHLGSMPPNQPGNGQPTQHMTLQQQQQQLQQQQMMHQMMLQQQQQQMQQQQQQQEQREPQMQNNNYPEEYEEQEEHNMGNMDDMDINTFGMETAPANKSFIDKLIDFFKDPLVVGLLFVLISLPQFNNLILRFVPLVSSNIYYNIGFKALVMVLVYSLLKFFVL